MGRKEAVDPAPHLEPEERLLLALGRLEPSARDREDANAAARSPGFRWDRAVDLACYHRVHLLLARNLGDAGLSDLVSPEAAERLRRIRMAAELRNERYLHATAEAFARLSADGIPVLLLKGAALAATVFPPGSRPLNDIDLLVRPEDYPRVAAVLEESRFLRAIPQGWTVESTTRDYHEVNFLRRVRNETLALDLHWRLFQRDRLARISMAGHDLPVADLLSRATPAALGPVRALVPSAEDMFVHAATQITTDGLALHLGRLADLDALARRGLDWERLVRIATRARAAGITHLALSFASMAGARVPEEPLRRLERACPTCGTASRVVAVPALPFGRRVLRTAALVALIPLLFDRPWHRLAYYLALVVPTAGTRRMHLLRAPDSALAHVRRARVALLAAACGMVLLAQRAAAACGFRRLAARLREGLWHAAAPEAPAPEAAEQREPVQVP